MTSVSDGAEEPLILPERRGAVQLLRFNRPERANAWTQPLEDAYLAALAAADADPEVRAIVVTGAGRTFCPGADFQALDAVAGSSDGWAVERELPSTYPLRVRKPLVAAINGACAGVGLAQALLCDVRFVAAEAKLTTAFARRGLTAEFGIAWMLERLVGRGRTLDLLLSGRVLRGEEAVAIGLAEFVAPADRVLEEAVAYATDVAENCSPRSMATIKAQAWSDLHREFDAAEAQSAELLEASLQWPDLQEGIASYLAQRPPAFPPLDSVDADRRA